MKSQLFTIESKPAGQNPRTFRIRSDPSVKWILQKPNGGGEVQSSPDLSLRPYAEFWLAAVSLLRPPIVYDACETAASDAPTRYRHRNSALDRAHFPENPSSLHCLTLDGVAVVAPRVQVKDIDGEFLRVAREAQHTHCLSGAHAGQVVQSSARCAAACLGSRRAPATPARGEPCSWTRMSCGRSSPMTETPDRASRQSSAARQAHRGSSC